MDSEIFTPVSSQERTRLFKDLAANRTEIICKGESDQIYQLNAERTNPRQELVCSIPFGIPSPQKEKTLVCNFFIGGERYFFSTPVKIEKEQVLLRMDSELFHLQRRQNYRIRIPENYSSSFLISELNKVSTKLSGSISDLSSGGCRVMITASTPVIEVGDKILGHIIINKREPLEVEGTVRHHKIEEFATKPAKQTFGVEFKPLSAFLEGKIFAITMDLHREFFSRLNTKI